MLYQEVGMSFSSSTTLYGPSLLAIICSFHPLLPIKKPGPRPGSSQKMSRGSSESHGLLSYQGSAELLLGAPPPIVSAHCLLFHSVMMIEETVPLCKGVNR